MPGERVVAAATQSEATAAGFGSVPAHDFLTDGTDDS